jgi:hypothetical protein
LYQVAILIDLLLWYQEKLAPLSVWTVLEPFFNRKNTKPDQVLPAVGLRRKARCRTFVTSKAASADLPVRNKHSAFIINTSA